MAVPVRYLEKIAQRFVDEVKFSQIIVNDDIRGGVIKDMFREGTIVKVYFLLNDYAGKITKLMLFDDKGELMYERFVDVDKLAHTGYLAKVEFDIRSVEL